MGAVCARGAKQSRTVLLSSMLHAGSLKLGPGSAGKSSLWMEKSGVCSWVGFVTIPTRKKSWLVKSKADG